MKIKNVKVYGLEESLVRSGYPMETGEPEDLEMVVSMNLVTDRDVTRAKRLANTPPSSGHSNFRKGIIVQFDMLYPQYLFGQFDRYNFWDDISDGVFPKTTELVDIVSSQSKMHKLTSVDGIEEHCNGYVLPEVLNLIDKLISFYNRWDKENTNSIFISEGIVIESKEECFQYIISNLPMGYELWMAVSTNYEQLATMYRQRKNHKLKHDWGYFCNWIESLPMAKELILTK